MKKRRRWQTIGLIIAFILMFIPINAMAAGHEVPIGGPYVADTGVYDLVGDSTNDHTEAYFLWQHDGDLYVAITSANHENQFMEINGVPVERLDVLEEGDPLIVLDGGGTEILNELPTGKSELDYFWVVGILPIPEDFDYADGIVISGGPTNAVGFQIKSVTYTIEGAISVYHEYPPAAPEMDIDQSIGTNSIDGIAADTYIIEPVEVGDYVYLSVEISIDGSLLLLADSGTADSETFAGGEGSVSVDAYGKVTITLDSAFDGMIDVEYLYRAVTEVMVSKEWHDDDDAEGLRPDDITIYLYRVFSINALWGDPYDEATFDADDGWEYTFDKLDKYNSEGKPYIYGISEEKLDDYKTVITGNADEGFIVANYLTGETDVTVNKFWVDDDDAEGMRPDQVKIQLWRYVVTGPMVMDAHEEEPIVDALPPEEVGEVVTFGAPWSYTYQDLDKYDEHGRLYHFFVHEVEVDDYYVSDEDGLDITNTLAYETDITVTKTWAGDADHMDMRPDEITVRLWRAVGDEDPVEIDAVTLDADGDWEYTFEDMDRFDGMGQLYIYSVSEDAVTGYTTVINGFAITNTAVIIPDESIPEVLPTPTPIPTATPTPIPIPDEEVPKTGQSAANSTIYGLLLLGLAGVITYFSRRKHRA